MAGQPSPLTACSATFNFLDFSINFVDRALKGQPVDDPPQEHQELEREAEKLLEVDSTHDLQDGFLNERRQSVVGTREAEQDEKRESERAVQGIYQRCQELANGLVSALQVSYIEGRDGSRPVKVDEKKRGSIDKYKKDMDSLKSECAAALLKLLSKCCHVRTCVTKPTTAQVCCSANHSCR